MSDLVAANSAAMVQQTSAGLTLGFAPVSALPGATLFLRGERAFQPPLRFRDPVKPVWDGYLESGRTMPKAPPHHWAKLAGVADYWTYRALD